MIWSLFKNIVGEIHIKPTFIFNWIRGQKIKKSKALLHLENEKLDREIKFRNDLEALNESFRGRGVTEAGVEPQINALKLERDKDIELINFKIRQLEIEES